MKMSDRTDRPRVRYRIRGGLRYPLNAANRALEDKARETAPSIYVEMAHEAANASVHANVRTRPDNAVLLYNRAFRIALNALLGDFEPKNIRVDERFSDELHSIATA